MKWNKTLEIGALALLVQAGVYAADPDALLSQADHLAEIGNSIKARPLYAQAEQEFRSRGDTKKELYAKFGRLHREVESGSYSAISEELERDLANPVVQNDPALKIRALSVKGIIDLNLNTAAALDDFTQIQTLARSIGDRKWENRASGELGIVAGVNGDVGAAAVALLKAISTAGALKDVAGQISFATWLANGMTVHGMADRAVPLIDNALTFVSKEPDAGFPVQLYIAKIRALVTMPDAAGKGPAEAKRLIDVALKYARENEILGAQTELLTQAGLLAIAAHDSATAQKCFQEVVDVAEKAHLPRMEAEGFLHLAEIHEQRKEFTEALTSIDSAIDQVRLVQEDFALPIYIARKAELEAGIGNLRIADILYGQSSELIEAMLINAPSSRVKSSMIAALSDIYIGHFRLAVSRLHDNAKAFRIIETARGRALADSIRYARQATVASGTSPTERQIALIQKRLRESPVSPAQTRILLAKLDQTYDQLATVEYERSRPEMKMARKPPVSVATLQRSLTPGEALIEFVLDNGGASHALEITRTSIQIHRLPKRGQVENLCQNFLRAVRAKSNWAEPGRALFEQVVLPAMASHPSSVIIVPDGPLNLIPFASLTDKTGAPLGRSVNLSLAPSATVFEMLRTARSEGQRPRPFLGVAYGPGRPEPGPERQDATRNLASAFSSLKPLPFARDEVLAGARVAGPESVTLLDGAATESALKAEPIRDFKIIHLAMHGFSDIADPDRAGLVLAPGDPKEDGLWQAREIRESRIGADLVTLSACETGVGRLQGEEGVMNLARTFLVAGAKSVVASLWDADDRSTATLMAHFYRQIATGKSVAEALRTAQIEMLKEFGSDMPPYYWAGFTVIGDGKRQISFTKTRSTVERAEGVDFR
jgi:CHAT domain-containing protein